MTYDLVIVGTGGVGSAALFHAADRGLNVLGIDRFDPPHDFGSSHGRSRIIRQAYFEHPDYVPLLEQSYQLWDRLESAVGKQLFCKTGILEVGFPDGPIVQPIIDCANKYSLDVEAMSADEVNRRFPMFRIPDEQTCVFESNAGYLKVEDCVASHLEKARDLGALRLNNTIVNSIRSERDSVKIETDDATIQSKKAIVTSGAWASRLLAGVEISNVKRKHQYWFDFETTRFQESSSCPAYFFETDAGYFYGFPAIDSSGCKVARHSGSDLVSDPSQVDRAIDQKDLQLVESFLESHLQTGKRRLRDHSVCMYTMTPDEHFIVDLLPGSENIAIAAGLSGHGFKFTPVLGKYLVDLLDGISIEHFHFLRANRFD